MLLTQRVQELIGIFIIDQLILGKCNLQPDFGHLHVPLLMLPCYCHYLFFASIQLLQKVVAFRVPEPNLGPLHALIVVVKDLVCKFVSNLKKI